MAHIYLFNPENDMALAHGSAYFTPPSVALSLARAGCCIPFWWADEDDSVLIPSDFDNERIHKFIYDNGLKGSIYRKETSAVPTPWGWSKYSRRQYSSAGVEMFRMPSDRTLDIYREFSHRRSAIKLYSIIRDQIQDYPFHDTPKEVTDISEIPSECFIKRPWSNSGRGVFDSRMLSRERILKLAADSVRSQGSVMVEPCLNKLLDFAMLFSCDHGVKYQGLSVFYAASGGEYSYNVIAPQKRLKELINSALNDNVILQRICDAVGHGLTHIVPPNYSGWVGVDMMVYDNGSGKQLVAPAIEINMRMTMGVVALMLSKHSLFCNKEAKLRIIPEHLFRPECHKLLSPRCSEGLCYVVEFSENTI